MNFQFGTVSPMSDLGEAVGAVFGLIFGGVLLLLIASALEPMGPTNMQSWGSLFVISGILLGIILITGLFLAIFSRIQS
ncbi:hypothetical protein ACLI4Q_10945 [Natrialbaceae archaeon A-CW1-1]